MPSAPDPLLLSFQAAVAGRYSLEREVGRGGMGVVFLARDERLQRPVAIKLLPPYLAAQATLRARLLAEARTAASLSHPNVVPIHAVEEIGELVFIVMGYVEGDSLGARVRARGPLPPVEVARVLRDAAWGLAYAHARRVVHRDVKPDNILLDDATGRALVADFGLAQAVREAGSGEVVGTPEFMSPEQASGEAVDGRSDLYALGLVGWYALSGVAPFRGATIAEVLGQQIARPAPPLADRIPRALAEVVERCLEKDPAHRFLTGEAMVEALESVLARRHLPMPVRAFLAESRRRSGYRLLTVWLAVLVIVPAGLWLLLLSGFRGRPPTAAFGAVGLVAVLLAAFAVVAPLARVVERVRRLRAAGYAREALVQALETELEDRREELGFLYGGRATRLERRVRRMVYGALALAAVCGALAFVVSYPAILGVFAAFGAACATAAAAAIVARELGTRRTDAREAGRLAFWRGRGGRLLFRLARSDR